MMRSKNSRFKKNKFKNKSRKQKNISNKRIKKCSYKKLKGGSGDKFSKEKLNYVLLNIIKDLHEYDIKNWFIAYGTLLGIVRQNSCIDQDDDIDIIISNSESDKLTRLIRDKQYNYYKNYNRSNFKKIILKEEYPTVDFYIISEQNYGNYNDTWEGLTWKNVYPFLKKKWHDVTLNLLTIILVN